MEINFLSCKENENEREIRYIMIVLFRWFDMCRDLSGILFRIFDKCNE